MTGSDRTDPTRAVPEAPVPDLAPLAYRTVPVPTRDRPGPWPGVVLVHDAFGAGDDLLLHEDLPAVLGEHLVGVRVDRHLLGAER